MVARWWLLFVCVLVAIGATAPACAQQALIGAPLVPCVAAVRSGDTPAAMLRTPRRFDCRTPQRDLPARDYWVVADVPPGGAGLRPTTVRSLSLWQRAATLTFVYADGALVSRAIDDVAAARSIELGAIFAQPVPVRGVPLVRLLWRIDGAINTRGLVVDPRLATPRDSARADLTLTALYGAFGGLCLALLIYNLSLWVALRHHFQLAYCAMVAALAVYAFSSSAALSWLWPELGNTLRLRVNYAALGVAAISALGFARHFFEPRVFEGAIARAARGVALLLAVATAAFVLFAPWQARLLDQLYAFAFLALTLFTVAVLVRAWRQRSNHLWAFAIAWAAPIALAAMRVANNFHLIGGSFLLDNSTLAAMALEALTSSVAIAYRIRLLMVERDEARAQETAARLLADTDPLTGLLNRRAFLRDAIGAGEPRLLVLADIDHFKRVNDTLGHDNGDEVLRRIARALRAVAPAGALVARVGGEEFAILAGAEWRRLPEQVLEAVRGTAMPFDLAVTVSVGSGQAVIATEHDWATLYRDADQALYAAKAAGRDRARGASLALAA